jgi:hypothetical protein
MNCTVAAFAQQISVTGTVSDNNDVLPGVSVTVKGTTIGTVTDVNGKYQISVPDEDAVLRFSFLGYATVEMVTGSKREIDVELVEDAQQVSEVVITAMGIKKDRKALPYSVQDINSNELLKNKTANPLRHIAAPATACM